MGMGMACMQAWSMRVCVMPESHGTPRNESKGVSKKGELFGPGSVCTGELNRLPDPVVHAVPGA